MNDRGTCQDCVYETTFNPLCMACCRYYESLDEFNLFDYYKDENYFEEEDDE
jgi:hypothetical protein